MQSLSVKTRLILFCAIAISGIVAAVAWLLITTKSDMRAAREEEIQKIVETATSMVAHFHELEKSGKMNRDEAQSAAKETLRKMKFSGSGYFLINSMDMKRVMHPITSQEEGKDLSQKKEKDGSIAAKLYVDAVQTGKDQFGFIHTYARKLGQETDERFPKINGAKLFEPWNWIIVSGVYIDDLQADFKQKLIQAAIFFALLAGLVSAIGYAIMRSLMNELGGEPKTVVKVMQAIANGDLTQSLPTHQPGSLLASVATMQERLKTLITQIRTSSQSVNQSTQALQHASSELNSASDNNVHSVNQMVNSIEHLIDDIKAISSLAQSSHEHSVAATDHTRKGEQIVQTVAQEMQRIVTSVDQASGTISGLVNRTQEITSVANVIKEIADQTNLLALNAAIEAARAGEQGRGFAIVADEVRKLAERTSEATLDITRRIQSVQEETRTVVEAMQLVRPLVEKGVSQTANVTDSLALIRRGTEETLDQIDQVANSTASQTNTSQEISALVRQIADSSRQSSDMANSTGRVVNELNQQANTLQNAVSVFKT